MSWNPASANPRAILSGLHSPFREMHIVKGKDGFLDGFDGFTELGMKGDALFSPQKRLLWHMASARLAQTQTHHMAMGETSPIVGLVNFCSYFKGRRREGEGGAEKPIHFEQSVFWTDSIMLLDTCACDYTHMAKRMGMACRKWCLRTSFSFITFVSVRICWLFLQLCLMVTLAGFSRDCNGVGKQRPSAMRNNREPPWTVAKCFFD